MSERERKQFIADSANREVGALEGYDCPKCLNRGYYHRVDENGKICTEDCVCIRNCDNKASIFLGIFGVILTILLTTDGLNNLKSIIQAALEKNTFCNAVYLVMIFCSIATTMIGLIWIIRVLGAQVGFHYEEGLDVDSKIFFEHISRNTYSNYKKKLLTL